MVETPKTIKDPFILRDRELSHGERFEQALDGTKSLKATIQTIYSFTRDFPEILKNQELKGRLIDRLLDLTKAPELTNAQKFQLILFLDQVGAERPDEMNIEHFMKNGCDLCQLVADIDIAAFKKKALIAAREHLENWADDFEELFLTPQQGPLQDYLLKQLNAPSHRAQLEATLNRVLEAPQNHPELYVWFFQKLMTSTDIPFAHKEGHCRCLEALLVLMHKLESSSAHRDLTKKIHQILSANRYAVIRSVISDTPIEYCREFLLLASKCSTLSGHDMKILQSLAAVVHPSLSSGQDDEDAEQEDILWTTAEGFEKAQERVAHLGTVEIAENAREIETARAHGDLRENSEYKFALEKRSRLQAELRMLSDQVNRARVITEQDVPTEEVGVGSVVELRDSNGQESTYTLLGPWDADPEKNILSIQSKLAKAMMGAKIGEVVSFQDTDYTITALHSYLNQTA